MSENQADQKQESGKIKKAFEANLRKLTALLQGESFFKPAKAASEELTVAIAELAKEEKEAMIKKIVAEARTLIQKKREFDKFVTLQKRELDKKVEEEQKKFNESAKALFGLVSDVGALEKSYYDTLKGAITLEPPVEVTKEENEE